MSTEKQIAYIWCTIIEYSIPKKTNNGLVNPTNQKAVMKIDNSTNTLACGKKLEKL